MTLRGTAAGLRRGPRSARPPRRPRAGTLLVSRAFGVAAFHIGLLAMGLWAWAVPALALLVPTLLATWRHRHPASPDPSGRTS